MTATADAARLRLDKWLWAARFYKTRSLAADEIGKGRVRVNEQPVKAAKEVHIGDRIEMRIGPVPRTVVVLGLSALRGPAPAAQLLYAETSESIEARRLAAEQRRQGIEPAQGIEHGRPTKRDRRHIEQAQVQWQRWSATLDDKH
jgi:ribosome-associated heat shock protein Hsp15